MEIVENKPLINFKLTKEEFLKRWTLAVEAAKQAKEAIATADSTIKANGDSIRAEVPEELVYDYDKHKTRHTNISVGSDSRYVKEKHGGLI